KITLPGAGHIDVDWPFIADHLKSRGQLNRQTLPGKRPLSSGVEGLNAREFPPFPPVFVFVTTPSRAPTLLSPLHEVASYAPFEFPARARPVPGPSLARHFAWGGHLPYERGSATCLDRDRSLSPQVDLILSFNDLEWPICLFWSVHDPGQVAQLKHGALLTGRLQYLYHLAGRRDIARTIPDFDVDRPAT